MTASSRSAKPEIPSLTGLRFWAAFCILLNHLAVGAVSIDNPLLHNLVAQTGVLGMNAFFILSGFIIHYNYHDRVSDFSARSYYEFLTARVSRLYPLFIIFFLVDLMSSDRILVSSGESLLKTLPYFFTMTQSWFYVRVDGALLHYFYSRASVSWSISTEMLMYIAYPLLLAVIMRDRATLAARCLFVIACIVLFSLGLAWLKNHPQVLNRLAQPFFGDLADPNAPPSFAWWFNWISPYTRFVEFIIGALVCHTYLTLRNLPVRPWERFVGPLGGLLALLFIAANGLPPEYASAQVTAVRDVVGYYPFLAAIIFCCARYPAALVTRFFSIRQFVRWGEYSYSLYLFHIFVYQAATYAEAPPLVAFLQVIGIWGVMLASSYILYTYIEMPGRRWMRQWLLGLWRGTPAPVHFSAPGPALAARERTERGPQDAP